MSTATPLTTPVPAGPQPLCVELRWVVRSRLHWERRLARVRGAPIEADSLPYREDVLEHLGREKEASRPIALIAPDLALGEAVAAHLGLFDAVLTAPPATAHELWRPGTGRRVRVRDLAKALRLHQWLKNLLLFIPLLTAHRFTDPVLLLRTALGVLAFGFLASSVYVANDLMDLQSDRRHPRKRRRPFASGRIPIGWGVTAIPILVAASFTLALWLSTAFAGVLVGYFIVTTAYTFGLKRLPLVDVLCLAGLYTLRIFAGGAVSDITVSSWLLAFSSFAFLSLALVKRFSELKVVEQSSGGSIRGRGYEVADLPLVSQMGVASGTLAVVVFALYVHSPEVAALYRAPMRLWLVCPLLFYWVSRVWLLAGRGRMHDDPVVFAARDRISYLLFAMTLVILMWAR